MKILVAVDGSAQSLAGLEALVAMLDTFRERPSLTLIQVQLPLPSSAAAQWVGREAVDKYYDDESEAALAAARAFLQGRAIPYTVEKRIGQPAAEIIDCATTGRFDWIAMGTHGHGALANLVMGSVATDVVTESPIPVLLMKK